MFSDNFVTSETFLGSGMKWESSEPDYFKAVHSCKISFTDVLNTLCKLYPYFKYLLTLLSIPITFS